MLSLYPNTQFMIEITNQAKTAKRLQCKQAMTQKLSSCSESTQVSPNNAIMQIIIINILIK